MFDTMMDLGLQNLKTACWVAEHNEKMVRDWFEHKSLVRKEMVNVATKVAEQAKINNRQWTEFAQASMKTAIEASRPQPAFFESFFRAPAGKN